MVEPTALRPVFSASDLEACARRELGWRNYVYPTRVANGKMNARNANREIAMMQAIVDHFSELAKKERLL